MNNRPEKVYCSKCFIYEAKFEGLCEDCFAKGIVARRSVSWFRLIMDILLKCVIAALILAYAVLYKNEFYNKWYVNLILWVAIWLMVDYYAYIKSLPRKLEIKIEEKKVG